MLTKKIVVLNKNGLHARPAAELVILAKQFSSEIWLKKNQQTEMVNAKSMTKILIMGAVQGDTLEITANGEDEQKAVESLAHFFNTQLKDK